MWVAPDLEPVIRVLLLAATRGGALIVHLAESLRCPSCGHTGRRWHVPMGEARERKLRRGDPGE